MKRSVLTVWIAVGVACAAVALTFAAEEPSAAGGWQVVYKAEFKDAKLPQEWLVVSGTGSGAEGALAIKADADSDGQVVLKEPKCPGSVRVEYDCVLTGTTPSDISTILNGTTEGFSDAYLLQFGGQENKQNRLRRQNVIVESTVSDKPQIEPGKKHHVVAQNDGGKISLTVDGKELFSYTDPRPLKGTWHSMVGIYTYGCTLKIMNLTVARKDAPAEAAPVK